MLISKILYISNEYIQNIRG